MKTRLAHLSRIASLLRTLGCLSLAICWSPTVARADDNAGPPMATNPDLDPDQDGLSNQQEAEAGTKPNPGGQDTDSDGALDGEDGFPLAPDLKPPRLPDVHYAVIDLTKLGCTESDNPIEVNDKGHVLLAEFKSYSGPVAGGGTVTWEKCTAEFWDPATQQKTTLPILNWDLDLAFTPSELSSFGRYLEGCTGGNHRSRLMNNSGVVCGVEVVAAQENVPTRLYPAKWSKSGGTVRLAACTAGLPPGTLEDYSGIAGAINDPGICFGPSGANLSYPSQTPGVQPGTKDYRTIWGTTIWKSPAEFWGFTEPQFWPAPPRGG